MSLRVTTDSRRESRTPGVFRFVGFAIAAIASIVLLTQAAGMFGDPSSPISRYRLPAAPPHVLLRGTLHRQALATLPALCAVEHERYQSCGKSRCWRWYEGMVSSWATVDVEWSSSPLPASMRLASSFRLEPRLPASVVVDRDRASGWKKIAQRGGLGFTDASLADASNNRIVERCIDEGTKVVIEACVSSPPERLEPCAGLASYGVVAGEAQSAVDSTADDIAMRIAGSFFALLLAVVAMVRPSSRLAEGLEQRATPHRRTLGAAWSLLAVPPIAGFADVLLHSSSPPSTWATGRGGFALGISVLALWLLFALGRVLQRRRTLFALSPVLATPRSLLAEASGTVELAVRARLREGGVKPLIGDDVVAFAEARIIERYKQGKSIRSVERRVVRPCDELEVVDESGDGALRLVAGILDVERREVTLKELSPRYAERGIQVERDSRHIDYRVEERVVRDGEPLYVLGDVSGIALKSSDQGYRAVRGAPTLGGSDVAPVLVYAGDERGLVATLTAQARWANSLAVVAGCASVALAALLALLAWL